MAVSRSRRPNHERDFLLRRNHMYGFISQAEADHLVALCVKWKRYGLTNEERIDFCNRVGCKEKDMDRKLRVFTAMIDRMKDGE